MKPMRTLFMVIGASLGYYHSAFAQLPDPKDILLKAQAAIQKAQSISYRAERYVIGTLKYGDMDAILTPYRGEVLLMRSPEDSFIGAKFVIRAERLRTEAKASDYGFTVAYDGRKVRKLIPKERVVYINDPDQTGQSLLVGAYDLVPRLLLSPEHFQSAISSANIKYSGVAVIEGVPCHIISASFPEGSSPLESRWFLGIDDYWPREIHHRSFQLGKQEITETIVLMNIKTDVAYAPSDFSADVPEGYSVKIYQGFGKTAPALKPGDASPDWTLKDLKGASHQLGDFVGKIVVLDFWATWCLPCLKAMECIEKLHTSFAKKGVVFLGVNIWEKGDPARFVKEKGFTYQIIQNGDDVAKDYGVAAMGIPTIYVIGPDGKILFGESGFTADTCPALERVIKEALIKAQR